MVVNKGVLDISVTDDKEMIVFFVNYNKTLKALIETCKVNAKTMGVDYIPISLFNEFMDKIKSAFTEGVTKKKWSDKFKKVK